MWLQTEAKKQNTYRNKDSRKQGKLCHLDNNKNSVGTTALANMLLEK
jgi:hypothetical protein